MDLTSYADLAVRLVNTAEPGRRDDGLASVESYRDLVSDRPHLGGRVTTNDVEALRLLRGELRLVFAAAARHDGQGWHVHLVESGSAADRYAAGAIAGLTGLVTASGTDRLGVCAASECERVLIASRPGGKHYCSEQCAPKANVRALRAPA